MNIPKIWAAALTAAAFTFFCNRNERPLHFGLPAIVLWAWERPEDLRFIETTRTGIAFLAATVMIWPDGSVWLHPRTQRLQLPASALLVAVVRIESSPQHRIAQMEPLISELRQIAEFPNVHGLQIDFDARGSERTFYRALLESLRRQTAKPIGVTALASWCAGDRWLDHEPIIEAVPMFFRMGRGESRYMSLVSSLCRSCIGLSTDEAWPLKRPEGIDHIYLFNPRAWTRADYFAALHRVENWK